MKQFLRINDPWKPENVLFVVAIAQLFLGGLYGWFYWRGLDRSGWIFVFSGPIYMILALIANRLRYFSLIVGFGLYAFLTITVHSVPPGSGVWQDGLILKGPILAFLLWGLLDERVTDPRRRLHALMTSVMLIGCAFGIQFAVERIMGLKELHSQMQDSLTSFVSHTPKQSSVGDFVNLFCKVNAHLFKELLIVSFIFGACSLAFTLLILKLAIQKGGTIIKNRTHAPITQKSDGSVLEL